MIIETGTGVAATDGALRWLSSALDRLPHLVIAAGFAGALHPDLRAGDLVLASELLDSDGCSRPTTWQSSSSSSFRCGRVQTATELIGDPARKRELGLATSALAVDMESAIVARWCHERNVPFTCLRAISDDATSGLSPTMLSLLTGGRVSIWRVCLAVARRPWLMIELCRLARDTRLAARRLAWGLEQLLSSAATATGPLAAWHK